MSRIDELLEMAAKRLENGATIEGDFLRNNQVTLDEAIALTVTMGAIITAYLKAPRYIQTALLLSGVNDGEIPESIIWSNAAQQIISQELDELIVKLRAV